MSKKVDFNFKILLLGDAAVGKTSLVNRFVHETFQKQYLLTIGMEPYTKYETLDGKDICYTIFDIAGSQQFTKLRSMFYRGSKGALVVFDLTRKSTLKEIPRWIDDAKDGSPDQDFILIGNKNDLVDEREVEKKDGEKMASKTGCIDYIETSAKTGDHVTEAFNTLGNDLLKIHKNE